MHELYRVISTHVEYMLHPDLLDILEKFVCKPKWVGVIGHPGFSTCRPIESSIIHHDICYDDLTQSWLNQPCGLNFEIVPGTVTWNWWEVDSPPIFPPGNDFDLSIKLFAGAHYHKRSYIGVPPGAKFIESTILNGPTLFRTDIPHAISFDTYGKTRYAITIRWDIKHIPDWETAVEKFSPLFA